MKRFVAMLIVTLFIGFILFAIMFWLLQKDFQYALNLALCGATGGLGAEYIRLMIEKRKKDKLTKAGK